MDKKEKSLSEKILKNHNNVEKRVTTKNKSLFIFILIITFISIIGIHTFLFLNKTNIPLEIKKKSYSLIPENEDLDFTEEAHRQLSREVATQTIVLATNNGALPLQKTDQVVLFGDGTKNTIYGGWGSGEVYNKGTTVNMSPVTILEGIENKKDKFIYVKNEVGYLLEQGMNGKTLTEDDIKEMSEKKDEAKRTIAILTISRRSGEGADRPQDSGNSGVLLSDSEIKTFNTLTKYFDKIVVILNVGSVIELNDIEKNEKTSILISFLPGMEAGNAIADILVGDAYPSAHLTDTWAKTIDDYPTTLTFKETPKYVKYKEGLFVGYRYFEEDEETQSKVVFPFGHGLSYTEFTLENECEFNEEKNIFTVNSKVTNIGDKAGRQVVQVYVKKPQNEKFVKVQRELVAFNKTKELKPGESETLKLHFNLNYLASYDDIGVTGKANKACYVLEKGDYLIYVGDSVAATRNNENLVYTHKQKEQIVTEEFSNQLIPSDPDVAQANEKPDFKSLFSSNDVENGNEDKKILKNKMIVRRLEENEDDTLPTDNFNKINFKSVLEEEYSMEELVDSLTDKELAYLSYGKSGYVRSGTGIIGGQFNSGLTKKYNIPYGDTCDGPAGLRQSEKKMGSTAWPCSTGLASSFDTNLLKQVGEETAKEARKIGCVFWLAPGMNIHRSPLCGRNFEYYSEDPYLSGKLAAAITQGVQSKRVSITLKHFAVNNKEYNRNGDNDENHLASDSRMAERVAREIYLKGFEIAVKEGKPWAIMSSYNRINGVKTSSSKDLLTNILRNEWNFEGFVMTDWYTNSQNDDEAHAGSSVKMPGGNVETIIEGLNEGTVTRDDLKRNILYLLNTLPKTFCIDALYKEPQNKIKITDEYIKIKIFDNIYRKGDAIWYEDCQDEDKGFNPTNTWTGNWISIYIDNEVDAYRLIKVRYASVGDGFGVGFKKYDEKLGEITDLEKTGDWQKWETSSTVSVRMPKGSYELTLEILGGKGDNLGNINYIEIM